MVLGEIFSFGLQIRPGQDGAADFLAVDFQETGRGRHAGASSATAKFPAVIPIRGLNMLPCAIFKARDIELCFPPSSRH
jgi:hypothetical protein